VQGLDLNQRPSDYEPRDPPLSTNNLTRNCTMLGPLLGPADDEVFTHAHTCSKLSS